MPVPRRRNNPTAAVHIYRALPPVVTSINCGDYYTKSETYARRHALQDTDAMHDWPIVGGRAGIGCLHGQQ